MSFIRHSFFRPSLKCSRRPVWKQHEPEEAPRPGSLTTIEERPAVFWKWPPLYQPNHPTPAGYPQGKATNAPTTVDGVTEPRDELSHPRMQVAA